LSYHFDLIILDEAQCIKNAVTKNTKYIKQLKCRSRIALTGTPIENNLVEL
jgi:non-specific serine/threonine protein kinase